MSFDEIKQKCRFWWAELGLRERRMVVVGGMALFAFVFYVAYWSPMQSTVAKLRHSIAAKSKTLAVMQDLDARMAALNSTRVERAEDVSTVTLLGDVQKLATEYGVSKPLKVIKQSSENAIELQFDKVDFDKLTELLNHVVKSYPVTIDQFTATATTVPGLVKVHLQLALAKS